MGLAWTAVALGDLVVQLGELADKQLSQHRQGAVLRGQVLTVVFNASRMAAWPIVETA